MGASAPPEPCRPTSSKTTCLVGRDLVWRHVPTRCRIGLDLCPRCVWMFYGEHHVTRGSIIEDPTRSEQRSNTNTDANTDASSGDRGLRRCRQGVGVHRGESLTEPDEVPDALHIRSLSLIHISEP